MKDLMRRSDFYQSPFDFMNEIEKDFDQFFNSRPRLYEQIPCDIEDKESHFLMRMDMPGVPAENIDLEIKDGVLKIKGRRESEVRKDGHYERNFGEYYRAVRLPEEVDQSDIQANLENGVLHIALAKSGAPHSKKIEVSKEKREGIWNRLLNLGKKSSSEGPNGQEHMDRVA